MNFTKLKEKAKENGVSLTYLASQIGRSKSFFIHLQEGRAVITPEMVSQLANILGTTSAYLNDETDDPAPDDSELLEILEDLRNDPDRRMLFHTLKGCTKEDILQAVKIIEALKK